MSDGVTLSNLLKFVYNESIFKSVIDSSLNINKILKLIDEIHCNKICSYMDFLEQFDSCYNIIENKLSTNDKYYLMKYKDILFEEVFNVMSSDNDESEYEDE